ncbi:ATP-binding protein [Methylobacterium oxalidis]|uniref:ATP-binding protein n=1 Tax=Methylobacterium oxalidis TaxID=944322 RepID=UPI001EDEE047|nr:AAA family ATPase [Methylobacterium oxalidis]
MDGIDAEHHPGTDPANVHPFERRPFVSVEDDESRFPPFGQKAAKPASAVLRWHGDADPNADRAWLVRDLIPEEGKGLMAGQWGAGKTFGALDLSACVMTGLPFANRRTERIGGVLFIAPEGAFEIPIRLRGLTECKLRQAVEDGSIDEDAAARVERLPFAWAEECPRLVDRNAAEQLIETATLAQEHLRDVFGLPLALVIIDTVAAGAGFNDENSAAESQKVMDAMQALARATGAFVLGVDHFGKASETGTRGSSAKESAADVVLAFLATRDEAGNVSNTRMALRKLRGGKVGMETAYSLDVVQVGETFAREPITTCVVNWHYSLGETVAAAVKEKWPTSLRVFRTAMENTIAEHGKHLRPYGGEGPEVRAVSEPELRAEFCALYPANGETSEKRAEAKRKAFIRTMKTALDRSLVASREIGGVDHLWMVAPDAA